MKAIEKIKSIELSEQEKVVRNYQEEIDNFKEELPMTREELESFVELSIPLGERVDDPKKAQKKWFVNMKNGIDEAISLWVLKRDEEKEEMLQNIVEAIISSEEWKSVFVFDSKHVEMNINMDALLKIINKLDKNDRKFIKQIIKAVFKVEEKKENQRFKAIKKWNRIIKKGVFKSINKGADFKFSE